MRGYCSEQGVPLDAERSANALQGGCRSARERFNNRLRQTGAFVPHRAFESASRPMQRPLPRGRNGPRLSDASSRRPPVTAGTPSLAGRLDVAAI